MTNSILENIATRVSVRSFEARPVPAEMIEALLRAAMAAPSAMNLQPWEFIVVQRRESLDKLADGLPYAKMLYEAPLAIVVAAHSISARFWQQDAAAATENLLLAAHSMGLGAVWTASCDDERAAVVRSVLDVPADIQPFCVIPIGFPLNVRSPKDKWNTAKIHQEKW